MLESVEETGRSSRGPWLIAAVLLALGYLVPVALRPMFIPDEPRYGELAREMVATGDWIVPRLDGLRYFEKPPLQYWSTGLAQLAFGKTALAVRLTGALSVALTALLLVRAARRAGLESGQESSTGAGVGRWAGVVWASSLLVFVVGTVGIIDSLLAFLLTATLLSLHAWSAAEDRSAARRWLALCGASAGLAFLAKGFLAFAVPGVVAVVFLTWERRWGAFLRDLWVPAVSALLVLGPWCVAIALREDDFWRYFFFEEHVKRFAGEGAHHAEPFWFYVPIVLGGIAPWTFLLPAMLGGLRAGASQREAPAMARERSFLRFLMIWFAAGLAFFSASRGKLPTYVLPLLPPLALIVALGVTRALAAGRRQAFDRGALGVALLFGVAALALPVLQQVLERPPFGPEHTSHWVALTAALAAWSGAAFASSRVGQQEAKLAWFAVGPLGLMLASSFALPTRTFEKKVPGPLLAEAAALVLPGDVVVSDTNVVHAVTWTLAREDAYVLGSRSELTYGLSFPEAAHRALEAEGVRELMAARSPGQAVFVFRKLYRPAVPGEFGAEPTQALTAGMFLVQEFRAPAAPGAAAGPSQDPEQGEDSGQGEPPR